MTDEPGMQSVKFEQPKKIRCKKCGGKVRLICCEGYQCVFKWRGGHMNRLLFDERNHHHVICETCGHSWPMDCLDHRKSEDE